MRNRLIGLLSGKSLDTVADVECVVDHLLANGVFILPEDLRRTEDFSISAFIEAMQMYKEKDRYIKTPCKAGDVVYIKNRPLIISFLHIENEVHYVIQFDCDECGDCPFYEDDVSFEGEHDCKTMGYIQFTEKDIGKTVFFAKEEAEQKLKELNKGE